MKILLLSRTDCGGQHWLLANAMRKYLGWDARSAVQYTNYIDYGYHYKMGRFGWSKELQRFEPDLYIFQDNLFDTSFGSPTPENTIINGMGSIMRRNLKKMRYMQAEGWHVLPPISDHTLAGQLGGAPFENVMIDPSSFIEGRDPGFTICHAGTKDQKGKSAFEEAIHGLDVSWKVIKGLSWQGALIEKSKCSCLLDSLMAEGYGLNALEMLAMGKLVISGITPWQYALHPDLPIVSTYKKDLKEIIVDTIESEKQISLENIQNRKSFAVKFLPENVIPKWKHYIDWVLR
jgi:hypothetical protein